MDKLVQRWTKRGDDPSWVKIGRKIVSEWINVMRESDYPKIEMKKDEFVEDVLIREKILQQQAEIKIVEDSSCMSK